MNLVKTLILEHKVDVIARDDDNDTPVHVSALCVKEEVALALLSSNVTLNVNGALGRSLLHIVHAMEVNVRFLYLNTRLMSMLEMIENDIRPR